jgi:predicted DNA-binding protein (UPF0251 family)
MPRPRIPRRIFIPPRFLHFKPVGVPRRLLGSVRMTVDEIEAIRLADHEGLDHLPAAERMGISRPTFTRLLDAARAKLAHCVIEGNELIIEGGDVDFEHSLQRCRDCGDEVLGDAEQAGESPAEEPCQVCGSDNVEDLAAAALNGRLRGRQGRPARGKRSGGTGRREGR